MALVLAWRSPMLPMMALSRINGRKLLMQRKVWAFIEYGFFYPSSITLSVTQKAT